MKYFIDIIKGIMIGIANAVPGVSGGTIMVSMGIYDKIISSITGLLKHPVKSIKTLLPYAIGMLVGIVGALLAVSYLYANFPVQTCLAFIGLILGGLPILLKRIKGTTIRLPHIITFAVFFVFIIVLQIVGNNEGASASLSFSVTNYIILFVVGVIASATMVIPGVSGSMMLTILGYYQPISDRISDIVTTIKDGNMGEVGTMCLPLIPFTIGVVLGIFGVAKLIELLIAKKEALTFCGILGLVMASPIVIPMAMVASNGVPTVGVVEVLTGIVTLVIGTVIALFLGKE